LGEEIAVLSQTIAKSQSTIIMLWDFSLFLPEPRIFAGKFEPDGLSA
jgi:hypothetical protein